MRWNTHKCLCKLDKIPHFRHTPHYNHTLGRRCADTQQFGRRYWSTLYKQSMNRNLRYLQWLYSSFPPVVNSNNTAHAQLLDLQLYSATTYRCVRASGDCACCCCATLAGNPITLRSRVTTSCIQRVGVQIEQVCPWHHMRSIQL